MRFSIVVPVYDCEGASRLLYRNLKSIDDQTFDDYEVVVTDNSNNDQLQQVCSLFPNVRHSFNPIKGMAQNTNTGIKLAQGELIKILYMDDFFAHDDALKVLDINFWKVKWLVTGCNHYNGEQTFNNHYPKYAKEIKKGINTIGSPSVLTILNKDPLLFDENMTWMLDCDYYKRLHDKYGAGGILNDINVTIGLGDHQTTYKLPNEVKLQEEQYILNKHK